MVSELMILRFLLGECGLVQSISLCANCWVNGWNGPGPNPKILTTDDKLQSWCRQWLVHVMAQFYTHLLPVAMMGPKFSRWYSLSTCTCIVFRWPCTLVKLITRATQPELTCCVATTYTWASFTWNPLELHVLLVHGTKVLSSFISSRDGPMKSTKTRRTSCMFSRFRLNFLFYFRHCSIVHTCRVDFLCIYIPALFLHFLQIHPLFEMKFWRNFFP